MIRHIICSVLLTTLAINLSACLPAVFIAGAGTAGAMVYNKRNIPTFIQDTDATNTVLKEINADETLKEHTHVTITTVNRLMLLVGQASTPAERDRVYQIASHVPNLKRIYNELTIEPPTPVGVRSVDTWITTKVKTVLLAEKGLQSHDIKVITENKVVYLMGIVTPKQANLAAQGASTVSGVKKVVKIFEYQQ